MTDPTRSLVIPVYRETARIERTLDQLADSELARADTEIIVVDDGSDDGTVDLVVDSIRRTGLNARVIRRGAHLGKGSAVRIGMLAARGRTVVFTDADLSTPVPDIVACFEALEHDEADVVFGSRAHEGSSTARAPWYRAVAGRNFNLLLRGLRLTTTLDTQCGLKGFQADAARRIGTRLRTNGFAFDVEILARAERGGLRVMALPVTWSHVDESRVRPLRDGVAMTIDALRIRLRLAGSESVAGDEGRNTMTDEDVAVMAAREQAHWWFAAKRALVDSCLADLGPSRMLDVGAGGGALVTELRRGGHQAWAIDRSRVTARAGRERSGEVAGLAADAAALPVRPGSVDVITSLDVVEHLDDDVAALEGYLDVLRPGGRLIVTVPAYEWAWSEHDVTLGHRRRYVADGLRAALESAGFVVDRVTNFHSWLVPPAFVIRRTPVGRLVGDQEEASEGGRLLGPVLRALSQGELAVLRRRDLPVGLSLLAVAHRPG